MSTKPPIAARIPSARPRTLLTGSCPSLFSARSTTRSGGAIARMVVQPLEQRRERRACFAFARTRASIPAAVGRLRERIGEIRRPGSAAPRPARAQRTRRPAARDAVGDDGALTGDRVERRRVVRQRVAVDRPAVAAGENEARRRAGRRAWRTIGSGFPRLQARKRKGRALRENPPRFERTGGRAFRSRARPGGCRGGRRSAPTGRGTARSCSWLPRGSGCLRPSSPRASSWSRLTSLLVLALSPASRWAWAAGAAQAKPATTSVRMEWRMVT